MQGDVPICFPWFSLSIKVPYEKGQIVHVVHPPAYTKDWQKKSTDELELEMGVKLNREKGRREKVKDAPVTMTSTIKLPKDWKKKSHFSPPKAVSPDASPRAGSSGVGAVRMSLPEGHPARHLSVTNDDFNKKLSMFQKNDVAIMIARGDCIK